MSGINLSNLNSLSSMMSSLQGFSGLGNISSFGGSFGSSLGGVNIGQLLSGAYTTVEGFKSNDTNSQIQSAMNIVSFVSNLIQKFAGGEAAAAASDVAEGQQTISQGSAAVVQFERTGNEKIDACLEQVETEIQNVQTVLNAITEKQEEVKAANEQLAAQKQIIADNVAIVNTFNGSSTSNGENDENVSENDPNVVNSALAAIEGAEGQITTIACNVAQMVGFITEKEGTLAESTTNISEQLLNAQNTVVETLNNMSTQAAKDAAATVKDVTQMGVEGATNNAVGVAAQTVAAGSGLTTLFSFGLTAGLTAEAEKVSLDQFAAGATRIGGVSTNMAALGSSLGNATGEMATVASYAATIGEAATTSVNLIGEAGAALSELIVSTGSWANVTSEVETVNSAVQTYRDSMNADNGGNTGSKLNLETSNLFKSIIDSSSAAE